MPLAGQMMERAFDQRKCQLFAGHETVVGGETLRHAGDADYQGSQLLLGILLMLMPACLMVAIVAAATPTQRSPTLPMIA